LVEILAWSLGETLSNKTDFEFDQIAIYIKFPGENEFMAYWRLCEFSRYLSEYLMLPKGGVFGLKCFAPLWPFG
jgi:hypothetical protein